jgi:formylglycine-generating enzyme required for sulfatase activity
MVATGLRLPTEAEWEFACRAGSETPFYDGSTDEAAAGLLAWYAGNSWDPSNPGLQSHPVGGRSPNALGFHDMLGNVWEWVNDWFGNYTPDAAVDPTGPTSNPDQARVVRGGSGASPAHDVRSSTRRSQLAGIPDYFTGFRVARNP